MSNHTTPVSPKVTAAAITAALVTLIMYGLSFISFVASMPAPVSGALLVLVTGGVTFGIGYAKGDPDRF